MSPTFHTSLGLLDAVLGRHDDNNGSATVVLIDLCYLHL